MSWVSVNKNLSVQKRWNNKGIIEFLTNPLCSISFILISVHLHRIIWLKVHLMWLLILLLVVAFNTIPHNTLCHLLSISIQRWKQVICINNKANCMLSCSSSSLISFSLTLSLLPHERLLQFLLLLFSPIFLLFVPFLGSEPTTGGDWSCPGLVGVVLLSVCLPI